MVTKVTFTPPTASASAVTLHDVSTGDRFLSKMDGLVGPPAPRDVTRVRPGVDGIVDQTQFLGERVITLEGEIFKASGGASVSDLSSISEGLYASLLSPGRLEVTYENGSVRWCNAKLAGGVDVSVEGASRLVAYQAQLRAADPRWYEGPYATAGQSVTITAPNSSATGFVGLTSNSTTVTYTGTAPAPLTITVTAPSSGTLGADYMGLGQIGVKLPTAYANLVPDKWTGSTFPYPSSLIACQGAVTSGDVMRVYPTKTRTFYSSTRTAQSTNTTSGFTSPLQGVSGASDFPYLYPGVSTWLVSASALKTATTVNLNGATFKFEWFNAYW